MSGRLIGGPAATGLETAGWLRVLCWMVLQLYCQYLWISESIVLAAGTATNDLTAGVVRLITWHPALVAAVLVYVFVLLGLTLVFSWSLEACAAWWRRKGNVGAWLSVLIAVTMILVLFLLNQWCFPHSRLGPDLGLLQTHTVAWVLVQALICVVCLMYAVWCMTLFARRTVWLVLGLLGTLIAIDQTWQRTTLDHRSHRDQPDLIIIGFDSFRPELLLNPGHAAPAFSALVNNSVQLTQALTPLARTFPAWMSILTARFPARNGIRDNLHPRVDVLRQPTFTQFLGTLGYHRSFAIDDARFARIDHAQGFDVIGSPAHGLQDFALAEHADFALINLFGLLDLSRWIMPARFGNRAIYRFYHPSDFNVRLRDVLSELPDGPALIATHFCAAHWPYDPDAPATVNAARNLPQNYLNAVSWADRQIHVFMTDLATAGRLNNAYVVFMSDHGESFALAQDRYMLHGTAHHPVSNGHGSNVLGAESRIVLAFQHYVDGQPQWPSRKIGGAASLPDIGPTLLSLAGLPALTTADGIDLSPRWGGDTPMSMRLVPMETGLTSHALNTGHIDPASVVKELSGFYRLVDPGVLEARPEALQNILVAKQRAISDGTWVLAYDPREPPNARWQLANITTMHLHAAGCVEALPAAATSLRTGLRGAYPSDMDLQIALNAPCG